MSDIGTHKVLHNASIATQYPTDALVSTAAFYGSVTKIELNQHFHTIADSSDLPLYAYDIPAFTGIKVPSDLIKDGVIAGVKRHQR